MNIFDIKAGDSIQVGAIVGWRHWHYLLPYRSREIGLISLALYRDWHPREPMIGNPDVRTAGVYALKQRPSEREALSSFNYTEYDGIVLGRVALAGIVWEHEHGWRGQYARPVSFDEVHGKNADFAVRALRQRFLGPDQLE